MRNVILVISFCLLSIGCHHSKHDPLIPAGESRTSAHHDETQNQHKTTSPPQQPLSPPAIDISVVCEETMIGNPSGIIEMVALLKVSLEDGLTKMGYRVRCLSADKWQTSSDESYRLSIALVSYSHRGPKKVLYARYELTRAGQIMFKKDLFEINTVKGASVLVRALASRATDDVWRFLQK